MSTTTFQSVFFLALSVVLASLGSSEVADSSPDGHAVIGTDSYPPTAGSPLPCPILDSISDAGEISRTSLYDSMDFQDFGVQYWGTSFRRATLESAPHDALIIEPSLVGADASLLCREESFLPSEVMAIRRGGTRPVFGYLNVGELASYRDYWVEAFGSSCTLFDLSSDSAKVDATDEPDQTWPAWFGTHHRQHEMLSAFWTREWEAILLRRVDSLLALGFDGAFLDDVLHYFSWGDEEALASKSAARGGPATIAESARAMMALIVRLNRYARSEAPKANPNFKLIVNGAPYIGWDAIGDAMPADSVELDLFRCYVNSIDAILAENVVSRPDSGGLVEILRKEYVRRGIPVLTIEFWSPESTDMDFEQFRTTMRARAEEHGFRTYVVADGLFDRLYPPVSQTVPVNGPAQDVLWLQP